MKRLNDFRQFEATIDGGRIKSYVDFICAVQYKLRFPCNCLGSIDCYLDWMRDLSWIKADRIIIKIKCASSFMSENPQERNQILNDFVDIIIPFWENESSNVIVDGTKKTIMLCLTS